MGRCSVLPRSHGTRSGGRHPSHRRHEYVFDDLKLGEHLFENGDMSTRFSDRHALGSIETVNCRFGIFDERILEKQLS